MEARLFTYIHHDRKLVAVVELLCQTDFCAKTDDFLDLGANLAEQVSCSESQTVTTFLQEGSIQFPDLTVQGLIDDTKKYLKEDLQVRSFQTICVGDGVI